MRKIVVALSYVGMIEDAEAPRRRSAGRRDGKRAGGAARSAAGATRIVEAKQARSQATHERLLDALSELLQARSYGEISVADIARAAGLTTGAVYARFGDKRGVAVALIERFLAASFERMDSWGAQERWASATPQEIIDNWTRGAVNFGRMYRPFLRLMLEEPALREQHTTLIDHSSRILADLLRASLARPVDEHFDGDVEFAARAIMERFELQDDDESYARINRLICRITGVPEQAPAKATRGRRKREPS